MTAANASKFKRVHLKAFDRDECLSYLSCEAVNGLRDTQFSLAATTNQHISSHPSRYLIM